MGILLLHIAHLRNNSFSNWNTKTQRKQGNKTKEKKVLRKLIFLLISNIPRYFSLGPLKSVGLSVQDPRCHWGAVAHRILLCYVHLFSVKFFFMVEKYYFLMETNWMHFLLSVLAYVQTKSVLRADHVYLSASLSSSTFGTIWTIFGWMVF